MIYHHHHHHQSGAASVESSAAAVAFFFLSIWSVSKERKKWVLYTTHGTRISNPQPHVLYSARQTRSRLDRLREKQNKMIGNSPLLARAKPSLFLLLLLLLLAPAPTTLFQFPSALFTVGGFFFLGLPDQPRVKKTIYGREFIEEIIRILFFFFFNFLYTKIVQF
jgi:hypothetical protein